MRYNVLKSCAALSCRACVDETTCVAEQYLTLRTGCSRGRTPKVVRPQQRKNPLPYSFSQRSHIGNLRQIRKQGKGRSSKRKENRRLSFLFAPAAGRGTLPPQRRRISRAGSAKTSPPGKGEHACGSSRTPVFRCRERSRPVRANPLTQFAHPGFPVQRKEPPRQGEHANAVRVSRSAGAENKSHV